MASALVYFVIGLIIGYLIGKAGSGKRVSHSVATPAPMPKQRSSPKRRSSRSKRRRR